MSRASRVAPAAATSRCSVSVSIKRHVAVEDERRAVVVEKRRRLLQRVAGAELRLLPHEGEARRVRALLDLLGTVAGDDDRAGCPQADSGAENMLQ